MVYRTKTEAGAMLATAGIERSSHSIPEVAARNGLSEGFFRGLIDRGLGPRVIELQGRKFITVEAETEWLREREAASQ